MLYVRPDRKEAGGSCLSNSVVRNLKLLFSIVRDLFEYSVL
jgi:hypothetical protein